MKQLLKVGLFSCLALLTGCVSQQYPRNQAEIKKTTPAVPSVSAPKQEQGERIPIFFLDASRTKQAAAELVLAVSWTFSGTSGGFTEPSDYSKIIGTSGIANQVSGPVALSFSTLYKKTSDPLRVYFNVGEGELHLWWSANANVATINPASLVNLSPAWLAASKELPATTEHPEGGISISSPTQNGQPLVFFMEFTKVETLFPGPKLKAMGIL
jgi:hypothetical protein